MVPLDESRDVSRGFPSDNKASVPSNGKLGPVESTKPGTVGVTEYFDANTEKANHVEDPRILEFI